MIEITKQIVINSDLREKRAALLENNALTDILFERDTYDQIAANIYRGRVKDVLPGMQATFVDIGIDKNAFLHISDIYPLLNADQKEKWEKNKLGIQHVLQPGQEIMLQVTKEPIGSKGPKVTCKVTIPGRYFVLLPFENRVGISRRITESGERKRLREIALEFAGNKYGLIVRTNAYQKPGATIRNDFEYLTGLWGKIQHDYDNSRAPSLVYKDAELIKLIVRDYLSLDVDRVTVDSKVDYNRLLGLTENIAPRIKKRIYYYDKETPIFENYQIEKEVKKLLQRKVWLNSGGYINFDTTEALVSVDVNTGKYTGKKNLQDTVFKTNLEAAREIARQLKLRDIGGIIIIDFIDMEKREHQEEVLEVLEQKLANDRTKTSLLGLTKLGLVEMTRKKVREGLGKLVQKECPYCQGTGQVLSETTMALRVIREIKRMALKEEFAAILIELHPEVAAVLIGAGGEKLDELEKNLDKDIYITGNNKLHIEEYNILEKGSKDKLKKMALPVKEGEHYNVEIEEKHINNSEDGIARIKGYIIVVMGGGYLVEKEVEVEIEEARKTFAKAKLL